MSPDASASASMLGKDMIGIEEEEAHSGARGEESSTKRAGEAASTVVSHLERNQSAATAAPGEESPSLARGVPPCPPCCCPCCCTHTGTKPPLPAAGAAGGESSEAPAAAAAEAFGDAVKVVAREIRLAVQAMVAAATACTFAVAAVAICFMFSPVLKEWMLSQQLR